MRANIGKVLEAFALRRFDASGRDIKGDSKGTCSLRGQTVYSYAMPIAEWRENGHVLWIADEAGNSRTTTGQIRAVALALETCRAHEECRASFDRGHQCWEARYRFRACTKHEDCRGSLELGRACLRRQALGI